MTLAERLQQAVQAQKRGQLNEAAEIYQEILVQNPRHPETLHLLGMLRHKQGNAAEAIERITRSIQLAPRAVSFSNLSLVLYKNDKLAAAEAAARQAITLDPDYWRTYRHLGWIYLAQKKPEQAAGCFQRYSERDGGSSSAWNDLAVALLACQREREAIAALQRALKLKPDSVEALGNLGKALDLTGQSQAAIDTLNEAQRLSPSSYEIALNLGVAYEHARQPEQALEVYRRAVEIHPDEPLLRMNRAHVNLHLESFTDGWQDLEARWQCEEVEMLPDLPMWDGSALQGRSILVVAERGLGDVIQFSRFVPALVQRGGRVFVQCQKSLVRLLQTIPQVSQVVSRGEPLPECDCQVPIMSLPHLLNLGDDISAEVPYLFPSPHAIAPWQTLLEQTEGLRIGIAWQGSPTYRGDRTRSIPLNYFLPLASVPGVQLCSLQKGDGLEQLDALEKHGERRIVRFDQASCDMMQTAALMQSLDLVITSDTSLAHLAGALGLPTWVALQYAPDWRWLNQGETSRWYPTMRLFRQRAPGDWVSVFSQMARELDRKVAAAKPTVGCLLPVLNRPEYVKRCFESIAKSDLTGVHLLIVDDASDEEAAKLAESFEFPSAASVTRVQHEKNRGIAHNVVTYWDQLRASGVDLLAILDSDTLVTSNWVDCLRWAWIESAFLGDRIITGFNAANGRYHQKVIKDYGSFLTKDTCDGISMLFAAKMYDVYLRPGAEHLSQDRKRDWDWFVVRNLRGAGGRIVCTKPSCVQHIGRNGLYSSPELFDYATDFPDDEP